MDLSGTVPFNDLRRNVTDIAEELSEAFERVLASGWFVMGPEHDAFEQELQAFVDVPHAIAVGNGTDALQLALTGVGVQPGDHVITAANAGGYASAAAELVGARPVYADVDPSTHLLTPEALDIAYRERENSDSVVVVTHLYGAMADMPAIMAWAGSRDVAVIEDCAQALGATRASRRAGSFGHAATTSFYPTKNLGALGDGGAVFTSDDAVASRVRRQRQYGWASKYSVDTSGGRNSRLDELQAAFLRIKLARLDVWNDRRREIHRRYERALSSDNVRLVNSSVDESFIAHLAVLEAEDRESVSKSFSGHRVRTDVHYPFPDHLQPLRRSASTPSLPVTEQLAGRVLSLPLFPELTHDEVEQVAGVLERLE
jgi:dTDP-4-amino-4,6-dideoxygalactose transaminase